MYVSLVHIHVPIYTQMSYCYTQMSVISSYVGDNFQKFAGKMT